MAAKVAESAVKNQKGEKTAHAFTAETKRKPTLESIGVRSALRNGNLVAGPMGKLSRVHPIVLGGTRIVKVAPLRARKKPALSRLANLI